MKNDFLEKMVAYKHSLIKKKKAFYAALKKNIDHDQLTRYSIFKKTISKGGQLNLIAEIKKASPSVGMLRSDFDVLALAKVYAFHGAAAISVLTEDKYFLGKPGYIKHISSVLKIPILTKDFIINEVQIYETYSCGTSAILLIVAILKNEELKHLLNVAHKLDLDCLVEVHDKKELDRALKCGAEIIGVNNRNLHTLKVDLNVSEKLIPKIPKGKVIVAESGIKTHEEIKIITELGAHAVLIGESFLKAKDVGEKIQEIMHGTFHTN